MLPDVDLTADAGPILYDERNPQSPVVLRRIRGHIEVDDDSRLTEGCLTEGLFNPYNYLWMPVLCVTARWCFMMDATGISSFWGLGWLELPLRCPFHPRRRILVGSALSLRADSVL